MQIVCRVWKTEGIRMQRKQAVTLIAAAILCQALAACGGSGTGGSSDGGAADSTDAAAQETASEGQDGAEGQASSAEETQEEAEDPEAEDRVIYEIRYDSDGIETTHYVYDLGGRVLSREEMTYPDDPPYNVRTYTYAVDGTIQHWEDEEGSFGDFYPDGSVQYAHIAGGNTYEYNEKGLLTHEYYARDSWHYLYTYDEQDRISVEECYGGAEDEEYGTFVGRTEYHYSDDGLHVETTEYGTDGNVIETAAGYYEAMDYDSSGNLLYRHHSSRSGNNDWEWKYAYDEAGNMTEEVRTAAGSVTEETHWVYENGNLMRKERIVGAATVTTSYSRDEQGRPLTVTVRTENNQDGTLLEEYVSELYEYDDHGNLSKEYRFSQPEYDSSTGETAAMYETYGTDGWERMTIYVYGYDGDPYSKMPPET